MKKLALVVGLAATLFATAAEAMTKPQRTLWASQHNLDGLATGALLSVAHNRSDCQNMRGSKAPAALLDQCIHGKRGIAVGHHDTANQRVGSKCTLRVGRF